MVIDRLCFMNGVSMCETDLLGSEKGLMS